MVLLGLGVLVGRGLLVVFCFCFLLLFALSLSDFGCARRRGYLFLLFVCNSVLFCGGWGFVWVCFWVFLSLLRLGCHRSSSGGLWF